MFAKEINLIINDLQDEIDKSKQRLLQESAIIAGYVSELAPFGVSGALKKSIKTTTITETFKFGVEITSNLSYATEQTEQPKYHLKHDSLSEWTSQKTFKKFGSLGKNKKWKARKGGMSREQIKYIRGLYKAKRDDIGEKYLYDYVGKAIDKYGGVNSLLKMISED